MTLYEIVYITTNTLYIFATDKLFDIFFDKKNCNLKFKRIVYLMYFVVISSIIFVTRLPIVMLGINIVFLILISLNYKSSFQKKLLSISLIYSIGIIIETTSSVVFGFFKLSGIEDSTFNSISALIFIRIVIFVLACLMSKYKSLLKKEYKIPKIYYLAFFLMSFGTMYLFIAQLGNDNITINHILISGFILTLVNVTMIVIDEKIYYAIITENEKNILKQQNIAYENQMEVIHQGTEAIRLMKHDFKNHLIMLSSLYKSGKLDEIEFHINKILGSIENETFSNSNNFVIDSIINFKLRSIKSENIKLSLDINVPMTMNILAFDLTTILANLLDNSITACKKSKEKILNIRISSKMDNLIILISNSYDGKLIYENGKFQTTKLFKTNHGLGMTSIEKALEKYRGEIRTSYTSDTFSVSVIIPYQK